VNKKKAKGKNQDPYENPVIGEKISTIHDERIAQKNKNQTEENKVLGFTERPERKKIKNAPESVTDR